MRRATFFTREVVRAGVRRPSTGRAVQTVWHLAHGTPSFAHRRVGVPIDFGVLRARHFGSLSELQPASLDVGDRVLLSKDLFSSGSRARVPLAKGTSATVQSITGKFRNREVQVDGLPFVDWLLFRCEFHHWRKEGAESGAAPSFGVGDRVTLSNDSKLLVWRIRKGAPGVVRKIEEGGGARILFERMLQTVTVHQKRLSVLQQVAPQKARGEMDILNEERERRSKDILKQSGSRKRLAEVPSLRSSDNRSRGLQTIRLRPVSSNRARVTKPSLREPRLNAHSRARTTEDEQCCVEEQDHVKSERGAVMNMPNNLDTNTNCVFGDEEGFVIQRNASMTKEVGATAVAEPERSGTSDVVQELGGSNVAVAVNPQEFMQIIGDMRRHAQHASSDSQPLEASLDKLEGLLTSQRCASSGAQSSRSLSDVLPAHTEDLMRWSLRLSLALVMVQMVVLSLVSAYLANCVLVIESRLASQWSHPRTADGDTS